MIIAHAVRRIYSFPAKTSGKSEKFNVLFHPDRTELDIVRGNKAHVHPFIFPHQGLLGGVLAVDVPKVAAGHLVFRQQVRSSWHSMLSYTGG